MFKKITLAALMGTLIGVSLGATPASAAAAAARDGVCQTGEFCYYFNSDHQGSVSDFTTSIPDYGTTAETCYEFKGAGNGQSQCVKNNAASAWNRSTQPVTVFYNSGYDGSVNSQTIQAGAKVNLKDGIKNQNASHRFGGGGGGTPGTGSYATPPTNPHPASVSRAPNATARTKFVDDQIRLLTGEADCWVGDYRTYESSTSNHNTGNALDCTISSRIGVHPSAAQKEQGWKLANWLKTHASRLDVRYVIWQGKIWSVARSSEGWRNYTVATDVTGGHYDHVHVSIQNPHGD
ncbi:Group B streptococcal surface immunogenic protein [Alloactinosynnema sp. L-07]|uniref:peptidase inhibitor family I36 protein n=1 Tax=Alloactinosynnema sp. L-07 TaxID=1653480 RepID=UPI00065EF8E1|nr:peptidase inhibitor family I36 protein [Alloactinosynnema sp. L-07]CRK61700.1 Group B streptococcal surface immunogenic protein [Alloactinosynnema sp. L-07]